MGGRPLRLMHASDLRLERPLHGVAHLNDAVRELFLQAPYEAARQVFDAALARRVDLLVLAGDVLIPSAAPPRAELFLAGQFERLAAKQIDVYWLLAPADPHGNWSARWPFPANVHPLDAEKPAAQTHAPSGEPRAQLFGWHPRRRGKKWPTEATRGSNDQVPSIGIVYDPLGLRADRPHPFDYLALGGRHAPHDVPGSSQTAHYCGSTQGLTPFETGPHGCTLVEISSDRHVQLERLTIDRARWIEQTLEIDPATDTDQFVSLLDDRIGRLATATPDRDLLISWSITGSGRLIRQLEETSLAADLLDDLRSRHGDRRPMAWSIGLSVQRPVNLPADWKNEQTILGDFLRLAQRHRTDDQLSLDIERFLPTNVRSGGSWHGPTIDWALEDASTRQRILSRSERLGIELLGQPHTVDLEAGDLEAGDLEAGDLEAGDLEAGDLEAREQTP